jgi:hypothetical protein
MMEAYNAVYAPQEEIELTEEQVWEKVENWVNSLLEEGYDLSECTWEEMYESYIEEQSKEANMATWAKANPKLAAAAAERERTRGTSATTNPLMKDMKSRLPAPKPAPTATTTPKPSPVTTKPVSTPARPTSAAPARPTSAAPARPTSAAASAAAPPAAASASTPKPPMTPLQAAGGAAALRSAVGGKPSPRSAATSIARRKLEAQGRENLFKAGGGQAAISQGPKRNVRGGGTAPSLTRSDVEKRGASAATLKQSYEYDAYDLVLEYLLAEGHADTVEEANYVMLEMDAEMVQDIVETCLDEAVKGAQRSIANRITGNDIRKVTRGNKDVYKKPKSNDDIENKVSGGSQLRKTSETENMNDRRDRERIEANKKSIQRLNAKPGEDDGDYDAGYHGDDDTSGGKRHYSLSRTNRDARRRRASGR